VTGSVSGPVSGPAYGRPGRGAWRAPLGWLAVCAAGAALVLVTAGGEEPGPVPLAWAALAGAVAVFAAGGLVRRAIAVVIALCGLGIVVTSWGAGWWPVAGGVVVAVAGVAAAVRGGGWPGMSGRYERSGPSAERSAWDAIDAGVDPTINPDEDNPDDKSQLFHKLGVCPP
jgi:hypothetical protein